jgi:uncharacterized protein involved in exopolysaccharide biosynthesis
LVEPDREQQRYVEEDEINLLDYWRVIQKRRKMIAWIVGVMVVTTLITSLFMTNIYQAKVVITPITAKDNGGGGAISVLAQQLGGVPGIVLPGGSSSAEIINLLKSNILREKIIERYQLLPVLFYEQWDTEKKDWKRGSGLSLNPLTYVGKLAKAITPTDQKSGRQKDGDVPDVWDGLRTLDSIVKINQNIKENVITITIDYYDPELAAKMIEYFLATLTDHMSGEAKRVATINRQYLEEQLGKTADPLIKQKIYNLIAQQVETSMMAEVKENFAFKVIDPPRAPDKKIKPKRSQMVLLSFFVAIFIGVFSAFFMEYLEKVKSRERERVNI